MAKELKLKKRSEVDDTDQWDLSVMYKNTKDWEKDYQMLPKRIKELEKFVGTLNKKKQIKLVLDEVMNVGRKLEKLYVWAQLKSSEDLSNQEALKALKTVELLWSDFSRVTAFMEPELSRLDQSMLEEMRDSKDFSDYKMYFEAVIRNLPHILTEGEESILAHLGLIFGDPYQIFSTFDNVDANFGKIKTGDKEVDLTHGNYGVLLENRDRGVRQRAFEAMYKEYEDHIHTLAEVLASQVKQQQTLAEIRKHESALARSLHINAVPESVYKSLIKAVHDHLDVFYQYIDKRKELLDVENLRMWDLRVPLTHVDFKFTYEEAVDMCVEAARPLGDDYCKVMKKGLLYGWVDRYENVGKRSGAFSGGCFDSPPYILMNFKGTLNDVFTLMHEAGHSMHSFLANKNQVYTMADYPIFTAEIASTVNERLLTEYLLNKLTGVQREAVIHYELDAIRATFFRQAMFADFELKMHEVVERKEPLTKDWLCTEYERLNELYYGETVVKDAYIQYEWARIPHFYYYFYVYQYATGIGAAYYFVEQIKKGKVEPYLNLLKSGGSDYPLPLIKKAGLDMTKPEYLKYVCERFSKLVEEL